MNSILYTSTSNIENYTKQHKNILGVSSFWFLFVGLCGIENKYNYIKFCGSYIIICGILSLIFWYDPVLNSINHWLDKYIATIYFIQFFIVNLHYRYLDLHKTCFLLASIIIFFIISDKFLQKQDLHNAFWSHIIFRYICYVGLLIAFVQHLSIEFIVVFTVIYFIHIFYLLLLDNIEYEMELFIASIFLVQILYYKLNLK